MKTTSRPNLFAGPQKAASGILLAAALCAVFSLPPPVSAFEGGGEGCGAGTCSECHTFDKEEAEEILSGIVDKVHGVDFSIVPGLWQVDAEAKGKRGTLYIDFSKSYVVSGRLLRLSDWKDVTSLTRSSLPAKVDFNSIPLGDAVVMGSRKAPKKVAVFTDPQCPYCEKLHGELKKILAERGDIAFYLKLFPLKSHPDAYRISTSIVCEQSLGYLEKSFAGEPVPDPACETEEIDGNLALARKLGIRSTPTLVLADGTILSGFKPAEKLLEIFDRVPPQP